MAETFPEIFLNLAEASAGAPGAIVLLGSHTDYSHGLLLAIATPWETTVEVAESRDGNYHFHFIGMGGPISCSPDGQIPDGLAAHLMGCIVVLQEQGFPIPPVSMLIRPDVPIGAGISGRAALQVAAMRALRSLFRFDLNDVTLARLAHRAEVEYADPNCSIVEQITASIADAGHMLFLDARTLDRRRLPLPDGAELLVVDSGVSTPSVNRCAERRGECEEICRRLSVPALRDVDDLEVLTPLPPLLRRRARYVVTEISRVGDAAKGVSARRLGELMNESHASLRDDYEVSAPPVDLLAELLRSAPSSFGARLIGSGFGGSCAALVQKGSAAAVGDAVLDRYRQQGGEGRVLIPKTG